MLFDIAPLFFYGCFGPRRLCREIFGRIVKFYIFYIFSLYKGKLMW